jgi:GNAT superfamily N-acetyltransferase
MVLSGQGLWREAGGAPRVTATAAALAALVEDNTVAWLTHAAHLPGAEWHEEPDAVWYLTGRPNPLLNGVARASLAAGAGDSAALDARIAGLLAPFRARRVPLCWWTGPGTRPARLGAHLARHGLRRAADAPGMAAELAALPAGPVGRPPPAGLGVARVADAGGVQAWLDAGQRAPTPEPVRATSAEVACRLALAPESPLRHYVAWLGRQPAAKATLFLGAGAAGVYNVLVHPDRRRRGIGTAITLALLREAAGLGYGVGVLAATAMAEGVYRRLGFREVTRIGLYVADPAADPS